MRQLNPDEADLWARVMATVKPLRAVPPAARPAVAPAAVASATPVKATKPSKALVRAVAAGRPSATRVVAMPPPPPRQNTLDGSWDKRLTRGIVSPDSAIDLHGHTLSSAHALLDDGLSRAIARGDRVLLLVTGKPPRPESERPHARGAIRAAIADWLGASRHADAIAAVRGAHPRHGGQGALYIVLRRGRG
ncbi:Smr/MutS family protein [Sphingomonas sp. A2-49]|uniref:Smr/MutS family protein n=1 Tax=Sphingomonas sp. A2-49 TaxID=1391375 RepID=UPI0021CF2C1F|nr:Smr/MutS family protein [Sphingomonas sp. A2-49]MCU6453193.1 Smr/MutS family protein [Sphingomonas sp. A2-49]